VITRKYILFLVLLICLSGVGFSQSRTRYRYELLGGMGPTNFLGELGGANHIGTHFLRDFDFNSTRFCLNGGLRYKNNPYFGFKGILSFAMLSGSDALTQEVYRHNRNLSFRSPIVELTAQAEYYFLREKSKNLYKISGINKKKKIKNLTAYIFAGFGFFYYSPHAKYKGTWYNLRSLHTEGQGLPGGPKQYSNFSICIPIGMGVRYALSKKWSIGAELSFRKTFTDYIDDVSGRYYDKAKLAAAYGNVSAALSDPSLNDVKNATMPNADGTGAQRGDPKYKDAYMFFTINIGYKFTQRGRTRAKF
jgi:hypothetical protein